MYMGTFQNTLTLLHESSNYQGCLLTANRSCLHIGEKKKSHSTVLCKKNNGLKTYLE